MTLSKSNVTFAAKLGLSAIVLIGLVASTGVANARDNGGVSDFFQQIFGGGNAQSSEPLPQPMFEDPSSPPLTVRMRPKHHTRPAQAARSPQETLQAIRNTTIFTDKTLQRGDAVMTASGMRVFNGSTSWPYNNDDFVALASAKQMKPAMRKELNAIDVASRMDQR
ncbi:hypothetical protein [Lichenihabitans psoromatis]|uniref:hypothetical protein n=1 Tax=Lichenihabitans psoromatis TaxID=2528642 RepID=UPI001036B50C|nr:hypothetical protein [Lichenihabitans psoromatis]